MQFIYSLPERRYRSNSGETNVSVQRTWPDSNQGVKVAASYMQNGKVIVEQVDYDGVDCQITVSQLLLTPAGVSRKAIGSFPKELPELKEEIRASTGIPQSTRDLVDRVLDTL